MQPKLELVHTMRHPIPERPSISHRTTARAVWLDCAVNETERLDLKASRALVTDAFRTTRALLIGFGHEYLRDTRQKLRAIGVSATGSMSSVGQLEDVARMGHGFTHVLVNFDAFDDVEAGVDALIAFRSDAPDLIVVLCSEMVGGDDFGTERSRICDATLKLPISGPRLIDGLVTAFLNHSEMY